MRLCGSFMHSRCSTASGAEKPGPQPAPRKKKPPALPTPARELRSLVSEARSSAASRESALLSLRRSSRFLERLELCVAAAERDALPCSDAVDALWAACALSAASGCLAAERASLAAAASRALTPAAARRPALLADAAWALAVARQAGGPLLPSLLAAASCAQLRWSGRELSALLWAAATVGGGCDGRRCSAVAEAHLVGQTLLRWSPPQLALAAWALAADDSQAGPAFSAVWAAARRSNTALRAGDTALTQLHQASLSLPPSLPPLPPPLAAAAASAWASRRPTRGTPRGDLRGGESALQREIASVLSSLGCAWEAEVVAFGYSVDFSVALSGGRRLLLEIDGPGHFARDEARVPLGATRLKRRQLTALASDGVLCAALPHWEWEGCAQAEREARLRGLIDV